MNQRGRARFPLPPPVQAGAGHPQPHYGLYSQPPPPAPGPDLQWPPLFPAGAGVVRPPPPLAPPAPLIRSPDTGAGPGLPSHPNITDVLRKQAQYNPGDLGPTAPTQAAKVKGYEKSRDPRRRGSGGRPPDPAAPPAPASVNPYDPTAVLEPHMATIRAAVDKVLGLGVRKDIYEETPSASPMSDREEVRTPWRPVDSPHPSLNTGTEEVTEVPDPSSDPVVVEGKCDEKKVLEDAMVRCNFCPEPGMIHIGQKMVHQSQHTPAFFSCAACNGRRKFEEFEDLVQHIHSLHKVTDGEMVLETIILPQLEGGLKMFRCGVKNCGKTFSALSEKCLLDHMEATHGAYYVKVGKGKYILRMCRICGDERTFSSDKELTDHIITGHPSDQFGETLDSEEDEDKDVDGGPVVEVKKEPLEEGEVEELTSNLLGPLSTPRASRPRHDPAPAPAPDSPQPGPSSVVTSSPIPPEPRVATKKKKEKKSKHISSSSETESESSEEEAERRRKKKKKLGKSRKNKKLTKEEKKFKKKIESFSPNELVEYLKEMKNKKKLLKEKSQPGGGESSGRPKYVPDPNTTFPETIDGKASHFYCLICSVYTGKLATWLDHRASYHHIEMYSQTKEVALKRFSDISDIDMQECVIGKQKFTIDPAGQCRECLDIFWSQNDHGTHLKDGKCLKLERERKEKEILSKRIKEKSAGPSASSSVVLPISPVRSRSPSPNIIWKPLPKPGDKGKKWKPLGYEETRNVYERSPSPDIVTSRQKVTEINIPKYVLDGRTAYYTCRLCKVPVGNLLAWLEHKVTMGHKTKYRAASLTDKMDEVIIGQSCSVLFLFGDDCNQCLPCKETFATNNQVKFATI